MDGKPEESNQPLRHRLGTRVATPEGALVALEGGLVRAIEDEYRLDRMAEKSCKAVEERSNRGVSTT